MPPKSFLGFSFDLFHNIVKQQFKNYTVLNKWNVNFVIKRLKQSHH